MIRCRLHPRNRGFHPGTRLALRPLAAAVVATLLLCGLTLQASSTPLTETDRVDILRTLIAKTGTARVVFPQGKNGLKIQAGGGVLNQAQTDQEALDLGPAARLGERVVITSIRFEGKRILFDINGGPRKVKWYNHIAVGMGSSMTPIGANHSMAQGSEVELVFPHGVPHLTPAQVMNYLNPAIDWAPHPIAEVMVKKLPPHVKKAITNHEVLVGMDTSMVIAARGRTNVKYRQQDPKTGEEYEEWVYGQPPESLFVKLEGDRVVETIAYHRDGTRVVQNQPQIQIPKRAPDNSPNRPSLAAAPGSAPDGSSRQADDQRPTLRRPGDQPVDRGQGNPSPVFLPSQGNPMPGDPASPGGGMPGGGMPDPNQMPGGGQMPGGQMPPR